MQDVSQTANNPKDTHQTLSKRADIKMVRPLSSMKKDTGRLFEPGEFGSKLPKPQPMAGRSTFNHTHMEDPFSEVPKPSPFKKPYIPE
jgi:hypothetical protein